MLYILIYLLVGLAIACGFELIDTRSPFYWKTFALATIGWPLFLLLLVIIYFVPLDKNIPD